MQFINSLRSKIISGEVTTSIRIWQRPRVKIGNSYSVEDGFVVIDSIREISLENVTGEMARESGFSGLVDLLKVAKHGNGRHVYLVQFHYQPNAL